MKDCPNCDYHFKDFISDIFMFIRQSLCWHHWIPLKPSNIYYKCHKCGDTTSLD